MGEEKDAKKTRQVILCLNCGSKWKIDKSDFQVPDVVTAILVQCPLCFAEEYQDEG
jgi:hypothetical protein